MTPNVRIASPSNRIIEIYADAEPLAKLVAAGWRVLAWLK